MKNILLSLIAFSGAFNLSGQSGWGKAEPAQFAKTVCSFDSSANAVVLLDSAYIAIERTGLPTAMANSLNTSNNTAIGYMLNNVSINSVVCTVYKRIQILNKEGIGSSDISIPFVSLWNLEKVTHLEAQTLNIGDKDKIQITKVKDGGFFYDTLVKGAATKIKFTFPDVKAGSIIEYKYTISTIGIFIRDWIFQGEIPVARSAVALKLPDYVYFDIRFQGNLPYTQDPIEHYNDRWNSITGIKVHYAMNNIPAKRAEPFITNINNYINKLRFYPETVNTVNGVSSHKSLQNWGEVARKVAVTDKLFAPTKNVVWGLYAREVTNNVTDKTGKVMAIYNRLHSILKWNKLYSYIPSSLSGKSELDTIGNSADINMILVSMLRSTGIKADPVLLSTKDHGKVDTTFYNPAQFNTVIAIAELDSAEVLIDATNPYSPWYLLPENDLNEQGLRISEVKGPDLKENYKTEWVDIFPQWSSSTSSSSTIEIDSSGNYKIRAMFTATDYCALAYRDRPEGKSVADCIRDLLKIPDDFDIRDQKVENETDVDKKIKIAFTLEKKNTSPSDSFIYLNPFPIKFYSDNPFRGNERTYPIDFGWPVQRNMTCSILIPENYRVVELPQTVKLLLKDSSVGLSLLVAQTEMNIQLRESFKVGRISYTAAMFDELKTIYSKMIEACNSSIVLQKK